jgi:hypothetical protein
MNAVLLLCGGSLLDAAGRARRSSVKVQYAPGQPGGFPELLSVRWNCPSGVMWLARCRESVRPWRRIGSRP